MEEISKSRLLNLEVLHAHLDRYKSLQSKMRNDEIAKEARERRLHETEHALVMALLGIGVATNVGVAIFIARFFSRHIRDRVLLIAENSNKLANQQCLPEPQNGEDEVAQLDRRFHAMAASLEAARLREREAIDSSEDVICSLTSDLRFHTVNQAVQRHWGFPKASLTGAEASSMAKLMSESEYKKAKLYFDRVKIEGAGRAIVLQLTRHGSRAEVDSAWSCHWSELDQLFFCVVHDVTAQKEQERMKQRFVSLLGTKLSTPLHDIGMQLAELERCAAPHIRPRGQTALRQSKQAAERIVALVQELLDLEGMEDGELRLNRTRCPLQSVFDAASASVQSFADYKKLRLKFPATELVADIDSKRLTQVMVNILSNAVKYSPEGGSIEIIVTKEVVPDGTTEGASFRVEILDEGPGIPPAALNELFARFKRLDRDIDKQTTGTGLGLAICKVIVERHRGKIGASNRSDKGSCFWFSIPLDTADALTAVES